MFKRQSRGLLDLVLASMCLWAACYYTPAGALFRSLGGWFLGVRASERPLLAYYNGGVYGRTDLGARPSAKVAVPPGALPEAEALALGVYSTLMDAAVVDRVMAYRAAQERNFALPSLESPVTGPAEWGRLLHALSEQQGSAELAVAVLFLGNEATAYAMRRTRVQGDAVDLVSLVKQLPPGYETQVALASKALMQGTAFALGWPVPPHAPITSPFGERLHPMLGYRKMHTGVDISMKEGSEVRSGGEGVVLRASEDAVNGRVLTVDHGRGVTTAYCHNSRLLVGVGARVVRGQVIALSGNTGRSTGPHLHYQLELGRVPVDPLRFGGTRSSSR